MIALIPVPLLTSLFALAPQPAPSAGADSNEDAGRRRVLMDRVVAVVDDEVVLWSDLDRQLKRSEQVALALSQMPGASEAQQRAKMESMRPLVLDELVDKYLVRKEAARLEITAADSELEAFLQNISRANQMTPEQLRAQVEQSGEYPSWDAYRAELRQDIVEYKALNWLSSFQVTDAQVRAYYNKMAKDESERVEVERLHFRPGSTESDARDRAFAAAQAATRRLKAGEAAAEVGQSLGAGKDIEQTVARGDIAPRLEDAVFGAKQGDVVGPLAAGQGYVVFRIVSRLASSAMEFEQAKERIRQQLEHEAFEAAQAELKQQLRSRAHIDLRL